MTTEVPGDGPRPQTSGRNPEVLRSRLSGWLQTQLPGGADPEIVAFDVPATNGMSSETIMLDALVTEDGRRQTLRCVVRMAPERSDVPVFPRYELDKQYRVMEIVGSRTKVPVPRTRWLEAGDAAAGAPFFVMDRVDGIVPADLMPYTLGGWLLDAGEQERRRLQDASVAVLAAVHEIAPSNADLTFLELDRPEPTPLRRHVGDQRDYYDWVRGDLHIPLIERGFAWLDANWPREESEPVLCWGDSRIGNVLYRDFAPVAVLDWEMATVCPRELDVGWLIFFHRFFQDLTEQFGLPGMPDFMRRDAIVATYEALSGWQLQDLDFYIVYAAVRHAIIMSRINQRAAHFGEVELPADADDLITHRATLAALLDGTYWGSVKR
jgi:aminoglycoside phosphotransferase (APT) family kinase protein